MSELANAAKKGFLARVSVAGYEYRLTEWEAGCRSVITAMHAKMATLQPMSPTTWIALPELLTGL